MTHCASVNTASQNTKAQSSDPLLDLFKATLRIRPDRIVVGEIRGAESLELIQAMTSGHGGCMSTVHATYPTDTLNRLETMALMSDVELPLFALRSQIVSANDIIVQTSRLRDGSRCVTHITEVDKNLSKDGYVLRDIFIRKTTGANAEGKIQSQLVTCGAMSRCAEAVHDKGMRFPKCLYLNQE